MKKFLSLIFIFCGCIPHIHTEDLTKVQIGMNYQEVLVILGEPQQRSFSKISYYIDTKEPYLHEAYVYKSHQNSTESLRNCFLIFTDKILREVNCL